jgi:hypothetical protein
VFVRFKKGLELFQETVVQKRNMTPIQILQKIFLLLAFGLPLSFTLIFWNLLTRK